MDDKIVIKFRLDDEIRKIVLNTNEPMTVDELVLMVQRVYSLNENLANAPQISFKYTDTDGDNVSVVDNSDIVYALLECNNYLRLNVEVNNRNHLERCISNEQLKKKLQKVRNEVDDILSQITDEDAEEPIHRNITTVESTSDVSGGINKSITNHLNSGPSYQISSAFEHELLNNSNAAETLQHNHEDATSEIEVGDNHANDLSLESTRIGPNSTHAMNEESRNIVQVPPGSAASQPRASPTPNFKPNVSNNPQFQNDLPVEPQIPSENNSIRSETPSMPTNHLNSIGGMEQTSVHNAPPMQPPMNNFRPPSQEPQSIPSAAVATHAGPPPMSAGKPTGPPPPGSAPFSPSGPLPSHFAPQPPNQFVRPPNQQPQYAGGQMMPPSGPPPNSMMPPSSMYPPTSMPPASDSSAPPPRPSFPQGPPMAGPPVSYARPPLAHGTSPYAPMMATGPGPMPHVNGAMPQQPPMMPGVGMPPRGAPPRSQPVGQTPLLPPSSNDFSNPMKSQPPSFGQQNFMPPTSYPAPRGSSGVPPARPPMGPPSMYQMPYGVNNAPGAPAMNPAFGQPPMFMHPPGTGGPGPN